MNQELKINDTFSEVFICSSKQLSKALTFKKPDTRLQENLGIYYGLIDKA